ncbi:hypothetical protein LOTGIDRAFT_229341 [Lottia gigantea]|uniref:Uncharacterized protein n=1 Tax=Lottia gigantea TaxID=225164 RepID=V3ZS68_LOTGI|nr:hypothetical protein LOTGIDRAFT_229341 [Lottia gigantea]ESO87212.1 hypothetical protein LOTGIDRAFT_229341 [Lottia gigantea]
MTDSKEMTNIFPCENYPNNGRMYFTGPEGNREHRVAVASENRAIGIGKQSLENSSEADYLWRASPRAPFPKSKSETVGSIGWGVKQFTDHTMALTGRQVVLGQFRQECENRNTHRYQNAWYPGPNDQIAPTSDAAMVMNTYKAQ